VVFQVQEDIPVQTLQAMNDLWSRSGKQFQTHLDEASVLAKTFGKTQGLIHGGHIQRRDDAPAGG